MMASRSADVGWESRIVVPSRRMTSRTPPLLDATVSTPSHRDVLPAEVDGDREEQRAGPDVHGIPPQRGLVAERVRDQPDDEPEQRHAPRLRRRPGRRFPDLAD